MTTNTYNLDCCELVYDKKNKIVIQNWNKYIGSVEFRQAIEKTIELFKVNKNTKAIISNTVKIGVLKNEDAAWAATYANPILIQNGLKKMAFILPTNSFGLFSINEYRSKSTVELKVDIFDNIDNAKKWVCQ